MIKSFTEFNSRYLKPRRFNESKDIDFLFFDGEAVDVFFHFDEFFSYTCYLQFYHGELRLSARSFERLREEVLRLFALRLGVSVSHVSLKFFVYA